MTPRHVRKRSLLCALLTECTPKQWEVFVKMYGDDINKIPAKKLDWAITQVTNTIHKNWGVI